MRTLPFVLLIACSSGASNARSTETTPRMSQTAVRASQVTVGLRTVTDPTPDTDRRVRVIAVVHDLDGEETVTDLGLYEGPLAEQEPAGDEVIRVSAGDEVLHLRRHGEFLDVTGDDEHLIERIQLPPGVELAPSQPLFELEE